MEANIGFIFLIIGCVAVMHLVRAQSQDGFISLDCGFPPKDSPYTEVSTNITYISDVHFIESGESKSIKEQYRSNFQRQAWTVRSFPQGIRNCYNFNVTKGTTYLIRGSFIYGNYDGLNVLPSFDLYLGPNRWTSIEIAGAINATLPEIIHPTTSNHLEICLVKTGETTPFVSALELRPLANDTYNAIAMSLKTFARAYLTSSTSGFIRFDEDVHDRVWIRLFRPMWSEIRTTTMINTDNGYDVPQIAVRTAAIPTNASEPLTISWTDDLKTSQYYVYMYFAEIETLKANETREFNITFNGKPFYGPYSPPKLRVNTVYSRSGLNSPNGSYEFSLVRTGRSTRPPLLNAIEIYTAIDFSETETDRNDVDCIRSIKGIYELNRISWQGDPCAPKEYTWDGLNCSYKALEPHRITSLNLSSSGLTGKITPYIQNLTQLTKLDLSNNSLTGSVPDFLAEMKSLMVINLSGNKLNGTVPQALLDRQKDRLELHFDANLCGSNSCNSNKTEHKKNLLVPIVASVASLVVVIVLLALFFILRRKKQKQIEGREISSAANVAETRPNTETKYNNSSNPTILTKERRFSYSDVMEITNNFERVLGKGGFGVVYHGYLNDTEQVAVKMLSQSSAQGYKQFKAEVELLLRVHHKNLVSLVGYCDEGDNLALVYECMSNGDLKEHLKGQRGRNVLSWGTRLQIAAEAAQGLEYLHNGCKPPIVHRDVKATNILLNEHFQAKLADFGLSRSFPIEGETHVSTVVAGTPGYLDPEYYRTNWLTEKSDVYSFGVALLEIITNQPVIDKNRERAHITEWVGVMLNRGDIRNIVDPHLGHGGFDTNTVWKAVELAMACVNPSSNKRPTMNYVVMELNECHASENSRTQGSREMESKSSIEVGMSFGSQMFPAPR